MENERIALTGQPCLRSFRFHVTVIGITLSRFLYGFDRGAISGASIGLVGEKYLTDHQYAELVSLPIFASVAGGVSVGFLQNRYGRKVALLLATLLYIVGMALCVFPHSYTIVLLFVGRSLCNFSFGMSHVTTLVYLIELTPAQLRGRALVANQLVKPIGNTLSGLTNLAVSKLAGDENWRLMLGLTFCVSVLQLVLILPLPKSFQWLYAKGNLDRALKEAEKLYCGLTRQQFKILLNLDSSESKESTQVKDKHVPIEKGTFRRMVIVAVSLITIGQLSGFSSIMFYSVQVAHTTGIGASGDDSSGVFLVSEAIFVANVIGCLISMFLIERLGRRKLLLASQIGTFFSLVLIVAAVALIDSCELKGDPWPDVVNPDCLVETCSACVSQRYCGFCMFDTGNQTWGYCVDGTANHSILDRCEIAGGTYRSSHCDSSSNWFVVLAMLLFVIYFSIGLAPLPFVIAAEIFPPYWRDMFTCIVISLYYTLTSASNLVFGELLPIFGIKYIFSAFAILTLGGLLFVWFYVPETGGGTPQDAFRLFADPWCCERVSDTDICYQPISNVSAGSESPSDENRCISPDENNYSIGSIN